MSTITAPSYSSSTFFVGKGIQGANGAQFNLFGQSIPNALSVSGIQPAYSVIGSTTLFDVSSLTSNHEVIIVGYNSPNFISSTSTATARWYRNRDNVKVFEASFNLTPSGSQRMSGVFWIGWLSENPNVGTYPYYKEIQENGQYHVDITVTGAESLSTTIPFAVIGIPAHIVADNVTMDTFDYQIRLSNYFDNTNYIRAGICLSNFTDGQSSEPSNIQNTHSSWTSISAGCAMEGTVVGLASGTSYTVYGFVQAANGLYYKVGAPATITTLAGAPTIPSTPVDFTSRIEGGFELFWGASFGTTPIYYEVNYRPSYVGGWLWSSKFSNANTNRTSLTGLQFGVTYDFRVYAYNSKGNSDYTYVSSWTTAPQTPTISQGAITNTSITINAGAMSGNYDEIQIQRYTAGSVYIDEKYCQGGGSVTWSGLTTGTTYIFKARSKFFINSINLYSVNFSNNLTISPSSRPPDFSWDTAKSYGGNFNLTASEWNRLTAKINSFRVDYKGMSSFGFTTAVSGANFEAFYYRQACNAIAEMNPPTSAPPLRYTGDSIFASDIDGLRLSLNSIV